MSEFLLIAPGDWTEVSIDDVCNATSSGREKFPTWEGGTDLWELNDQLRAAGLLPEGKEVVGVTYLSDHDRLWFKYE